MAAFWALVDNQLGTPEDTSAFSKVDDEAALGIRADQEVFHGQELVICKQ